MSILCFWKHFLFRIWWKTLPAFSDTSGCIFLHRYWKGLEHSCNDSEIYQHTHVVKITHMTYIQPAQIFKRKETDVGRIYKKRTTKLKAKHLFPQVAGGHHMPSLPEQSGAQHWTAWRDHKGCRIAHFSKLYSESLTTCPVVSCAGSGRIQVRLHCKLRSWQCSIPFSVLTENYFIIALL